MAYSIDTSAILDGWVRYYPPDIFPPVWERISELAESGELLATEEVLHELEKKHDEVHKWAKSRPHIFVPLDEEIQLCVSREILANHPRLIDTRANRSMADPFVIGLARIRGLVVVTGEHRSNNIDKPHIPDVCEAMGIKTINLLQLFRELGWVFKR